ncbi:MAG: acyl dehydratase [Hyphomicrobiaceae bacterium]|jgi:acyl dehydratase
MADIKIVPKDQLADYIGKEFGPTDWVEMTQEKVNAFAEVTNDHQFIHVDVEAAKQTPFGGTIAHGFFTLSLLAYFQGQANIVPEGIAMAVNYGLNKVRFLQPVPTGKRVRGRIKPVSFLEKAPGQILATNQVTVEIEGETKPALIAETLAMFYLS